jgi:hypothetical protein
MFYRLWCVRQLVTTFYELATLAMGFEILKGMTKTDFWFLNFSSAF